MCGPGTHTGGTGGTGRIPEGRRGTGRGGITGFARSGRDAEDLRGARRLPEDERLPDGPAPAERAGGRAHAHDAAQGAARDRRGDGPPSTAATVSADSDGDRAPGHPRSTPARRANGHGRPARPNPARGGANRPRNVRHGARDR
ncbi:hypothetical protein ADK41_11715 [Streptomyces caelestis]|uniref:Uncharacterized protein n=1 Tax=Streptomyces caelestis TaxID=36816 RepID=A0A0N0S677_9ACTN|nr:hypothetical protein ADK41_11715 [Streptomyces caelestis]KOV36388.1 hypothetical protein ADK58_00865 [Streptomyces sp. XY152]